MARQPKQLPFSAAMKELGTPASGRQYGEFNGLDFLPQLRGQRALRTYREMRDNDPIIGAILSAMEMMIRGVEWRVESGDPDNPNEDAIEFMESILDDMDHTWDDFISEVLTFLPYGFSFFETVMKRRPDGRFGIKKLSPRAQWTLQKWEFDSESNLTGLTQSGDFGTVTIPIEKGLLFRTTNSADDPSGRSVLRNAYRSWFYAKHIMSIEAIAIERELNGLPVGRIPSEYLSATDGPRKTFRDTFEKILRDVKLNEQGYVMLPSDRWTDSDGNPTSEHLVEFGLIASEGTRDIDTGKVILRHQQDMARAVLADFIMLGATGKGSFALSKSKTDLFLASLKGYVETIAATLNRKLVPQIWAINGFPEDTIPELKPGRVDPVDLAELGEFVQRMAGAGAPLFPDDELSNHLRDVAGLPEQPADMMDMMGRPDEPDPIEDMDEDGEEQDA